jgi:hypothetical protein
MSHLKDLKVMTLANPYLQPPNWSKFLLTHARPYDFVSSQWQRSRKDRVSLIYLGYRVIVALFVLCNYIATMDSYGWELEYYFIYLTNQGITLLLAAELFKTGHAAYEWGRMKKDEEFKTL